MVDALKEVNEIGTDQYRKYLEKLTPGQGKSLDENNMALMKKAAGGAMQTLKMKDGKLKMDSFTASAIMAIYKAVNPKNKKTMENLINTGNKAAMMKLQKFAMSKINSGDELEHDGDELQEHHQKDENGNTIPHDDEEELKEHKGTKPHPHPHKEKDEAVDPADVDDDATDDDIKAADKNIMMQMRKVISLRGNFKVEFGDKKKVKIDPKIAQAVQKKYDSMRKPMDKEKFQAKVSKSYKDMLSALKESLDESVSVKDFDALKKGDTITLDYKSAMSSGKGTFTVTAKNKVAKGKVEKVTLKNIKNPGGVKHFLYKRDDNVSFAQGDMGASVVSFKKEDVELDEAVKVGDTVKVKLNRKGKEYIEKGKVTKIEKDSIIVKHDFSRTPSRVSMKNIVKEEVELDEGKMSQLHQHIKDGKSAKEIAKIMKLDVKTIKALMGEELKEGTWGLPDTPKLMAGLKQLMKKPIPLGKDGDDAIKAIGKYIGDDGLYDDLYDAGKKDGPKADARPVISGWMDREFVGSWKKYRLVGLGRRHSTVETTTILDRIDKKLKERRNG
tara:strand:+ start:89 stop:1756 length:1668 start_codon:yes stop_codon:yes gene_type:complete